MPFVESVEEFHARHGRECIEVRDEETETGFFLYPDGARSSMNGLDRREPPADEYERAAWVEVYWEQRVSRAAEAFHDLRDQLLSAGQQAAAYGDAPPQEVERLRELRDEARRLQRRLAAARAAVEKVRPPAERVRADAKARDRQRGAEYLAAVKAIRL